ncbi:hypothetical protein BN871_CV_00140 [Paenibacillus sp. P22]|nr:hypothetical protein BN871_CV_00140 [Paenibacillus sp. P22]
MSNFMREWQMQIQSYSRNIRLFFVFNLLWNVGLGMYSLVYNLYVKALGYEPTMVGQIVGMTALASALILIPAGLANDRFGPKRMISIGAAAVVAALVLRAWLPGAGGLTGSAFAGGIAQAIVSATILPFMANNSTARQRIHLFSFNMALVMAANVVGNLAGGFITDLLQLAGMGEVLSLRLTLLIGAGIAGAGLIPVLMFGKEEEAASASMGGVGQPPSPVKGVRLKAAMKEHRSSFYAIGAFTLLSLLSSMAGGMVVPYLNVYFEDRFEASKSVIGLVVALGQGATAVAYLLGPAIARRMGGGQSGRMASAQLHPVSCPDRLYASILACRRRVLVPPGADECRESVLQYDQDEVCASLAPGAGGQLGRSDVQSGLVHRSTDQHGPCRQVRALPRVCVGIFGYGSHLYAHRRHVLVSFLQGPLQAGRGGRSLSRRLFQRS